jgi:hypothetical protein
MKATSKRLNKPDQQKKHWPQKGTKGTKRNLTLKFKIKPKSIETEKNIGHKKAEKAQKEI